MSLSINSPPLQVELHLACFFQLLLLLLVRTGSLWNNVQMGVEPKIGVFPPKSSILIGFSIIFTIHFGGPPLFLETPRSLRKDSSGGDPNLVVCFFSDLFRGGFTWPPFGWSIRVTWKKLLVYCFYSLSDPGLAIRFDWITNVAKSWNYTVYRSRSFMNWFWPTHYEFWFTS